jgi:hypothetical protein
MAFFSKFYPFLAYIPSIIFRIPPPSQPKNTAESNHLNVNNSLIAEFELNEDAEILNYKEEETVHDSQQVEEINLGTDEDPQIVKIAITRDLTERHRWVDFLKQYK